jgi:hypothetical protein
MIPSIKMGVYAYLETETETETETEMKRIKADKQAPIRLRELYWVLNKGKIT